MKRFIFTGLVLMVSMPALAVDVVDDGSIVILPVEAQQCALPSAPAPIPEVPEKADLLKAQKQVRLFQADMQSYRDCVNQYAEGPEVTLGNQQAISNAHNYSVDMEERVAAMFNEAVRAYKAGLAKD